MFLIDTPPFPYHDPWVSSFEERIKTLSRGEQRVAYFYETPDNSTFRYRVYNMIQTLQSAKNGVSAAYFTQREIDDLDKVIDISDVLVICRSRYNDKLNHAITKARNKGKKVFFDVDDLVFNTDYIHLLLDTLDQDLNHPNVWDFWAAYTARLGMTLKLCDEAITTNQYLAAQIQAFTKKNVSIIPNFLNREQLNYSEKIFEEKKAKNFARNDQIHLGYFSGTPSHNKDLEIISDSLVNLLESDPRLVVRIVGYIDIKGPLQNYQSRIEMIPLQDFINLQRYIGEVEINLVPLQDNEFTNCKSELKYFEAGIVGTLSIATPTYTFINAIDPPANGYLAKSHEWFAAIQNCIYSLPTYSEIAQVAYDRSLVEYSYENFAEKLNNSLFSIHENDSNIYPNENVHLRSDWVSEITPELSFRYSLSTEKKNRKQKLLSKISPLTDAGIEIGPLADPVVTKDESGGLIKYVDYAPADVLREIYKNDTYVKIKNIVDVDYIWGNKELIELTDGKLFDYVIASHVIEHVPDMLGWLKEISEILIAGGVLSLAIPDKRFTFDYYRELSSPGAIIEAYFRHNREPSPQAVFDYIALSQKIDVTSAWQKKVASEMKINEMLLIHAFNISKQSFDEATYHDAHVNVFTPISFLNLIELFSRLDLLDFEVVDFYDTKYNTIEFFASLEKIPENIQGKDKLDMQLSNINIFRKLLN